MNSFRNDLVWFHGLGSAQVLRMTQAFAKVHGDGNKGTKGTMPQGQGPDLDSLVRFGQVSRALGALTLEQEAVLRAAYGDLGRALSEGGTTPALRWRAVAPLTAVAANRGRGWVVKQKKRPEGYRKPVKPKKARSPEQVQADELKRDPTLGPPEARWVNQVLSTPRPTLEERAARAALRTQAQELLREAEKAFASAKGAVERGERAVDRAAAARRQAGEVAR